MTGAVAGGRAGRDGGQAKRDAIGDVGRLYLLFVRDLNFETGQDIARELLAGAAIGAVLIEQTLGRRDARGQGEKRRKRRGDYFTVHGDYYLSAETRAQMPAQIRLIL